jgi:MFS family permease
MLAITIINFILNFFFAVMVIYTPIYLINHIGFNWSELGVIFTIMLMPFVIFGFPTGLLIDKYKVSKRKILYVGFTIIILSTLSIAFISNTNIALWALVLFLTRMGASIIETTSEVYFFTHIKEEETYLLSIYRDMTPVAYLIAPLFATVVFMFVEFKYIYIILSVILASAFYYIKRLKHNHEYTIPNTNQ